MNNDIYREALNKVCIDGHLNAALDDVLKSNSPDEILNLLGNLAGKAIRIALDLAAPAKLPETIHPAVLNEMESRMEAAELQNCATSPIPTEDEIRSRLSGFIGMPNTPETRLAIVVTLASATAEDHRNLMLAEDGYPNAPHERSGDA